MNPTSAKPPEQLHPARVLVTGAGGGIGSRVVSHLLATGASVSALDREFTSGCPADRVLEGDATDPDVVDAALEGCDAMVHLAALPRPDLADPPTMIATNTVATMTVLASAAEKDVRQVSLASSINAFGVPFNHRQPLPAYYPIDENIPAELDDAYSLSKAHDELTATMAASRWDMAISCLRLPFTTDADGLETARRMLLRTPQRSVREGWSYLHVDDAARAFAAGLGLSDTGARVLFVAAEDSLLPWLTEEALDRYAPGVPRRRALPGRSSAVNTSRAAASLGFTPAYRHPQPQQTPPWPD